ncbi:MAG: 16S rRNA (cytosine(1402)-N(4))-methyltransferase RsmH [Chloroflexi bacterium]|nr:16S rRNA (cytosine(1402)-N(4))-methyltransferase RsmH [Chloroflexota bacterium]
MMRAEHVPVMVDECMRLLDPRPGGLFIDCTVDGGGHSAAILERTAPDGPLLALDADPDAVARARHRLASFGDRVRVVHANFRRVTSVTEAEGFTQADGILIDLGLSSVQIETVGRGFSFSRDEPLDMRFDPGVGMPASEFLRTATGDDIARVLRAYGEEPRARRIAAEIVSARSRAAIETTGQLATLVTRAVGGRRGHLHPATRTFQALRIVVNDELESLEEALPQTVPLLRRGGRLGVISFQSLEDRIVKSFLRRRAGFRSEVVPRDIPIAPPPADADLHILTRHPARPSSDEIARNPRSRSARLRSAERI